MFSSPARGGSTRRRHGDGPGLTGSVRSSRASTPATGRGGTPGGAAARRRDAARLDGGRDSIATQSIFAERGGADESVTGFDPARTDRQSRFVLDEGAVLSRDDNHAVTVYSRMPMEVSAALNVASPYDAVQSGLDPVTGFAYAVMREQCFIWSFVSRGHETPTCFSYTLPSSSESSSIAAETLVQCVFVPKSADREPGILFVFPDGLVRYSDHVSNALGSDRLQSTVLSLTSGEAVVQLHRCHPQLCVASTSHARLIGIRLVAQGGQLHPVAAIFAQPRGLFGRLFGAAAANMSLSSANFAGLTSCRRSDDGKGIATYDLYAISKSSLQKWSLVEGRGERLVYQEQLPATMAELDERIEEGSQSWESLRLVDAAMSAGGSVAVLYSFELVRDGPLHFGVAFFGETTQPGTSDPQPRITSLTTIQYSRMADSRPYSKPRLLLPLGGPVFFVVFTEAIIFRLMDSDGLEESIELRDVASNRIVGTGAEAHDVTSIEDIARLSVVTQKSGVLLVDVDVKAASALSELIASGKERNVVDTHRLKSKLERGVFHSDNVHNPISFDLPLDVRGDLVAAVEQLSDDIVRSESPSLSESVSLTAQLANRLERLHSLAAFLSLNGMLGSVSQNCLRRLCADAQLVAAAIDLWEYVNDLLSTPVRLQKAGNLVDDAVQELEREKLRRSTDVLRDFFRFDLRELGSVLGRVRALADRSAAEGIERQSFVTCEANRILLTAFQAAHRYRNETKDLYRLDSSKITFEAWTCTADDVRILRESAASTSLLLQERTRQLGTAIDHGSREFFVEALSTEEYERQMQITLKGQLCELAVHTLQVYEERLAYLGLAGGGHPSLEREFGALQAEYAQQRRAVLLPLVAIGRADVAFRLAERHRDFDSLTELCSTLPIEQQTQRVRSHLEKYGEPFAASLFTFYVQSGQMHTLLTQDEAFYDLLQRFFNANPALNRVAWLHDFALTDYRGAAQRLLGEAGQEKDNASSKRLMLSLAKLCHISQLTEEQLAAQSEQTAIEVLDDQLDLVNVHDRVRQTFTVKVRGEEHEDDGGDVEETAVMVAEQASLALSAVNPAHASLFAALVLRLFDGRVLMSEDLIDLLTLHDADGNSLTDFALAVDVFVRGRDMPPTRSRSTLATLWRRVILFDDWLAITDTSDTSDAVVAARLRSTALFHTLLSTAGNQATSEAVLDMAQMLAPPVSEAVQARLDTALQGRDFPEDLLDGLVEEGRQEVLAVRALFGNVDFERWYAEVRNLVGEALQADGGGGGGEAVQSIQVSADDADMTIAFPSGDNSQVMTS